MTTPGHRVRFGCRLALEDTPGQAVPLTDADYILLAGKPTLTLAPLHDGHVGDDPRGSGTLPSAGTSGRVGEITLSVLARGHALPYSQTVTPLELHRLLQIAGHLAQYQEAGDGTGIWLYVPSPDAETSATVDVEDMGVLYQLRGCRAASWSMGADAAGFVRAEVTARGAASLPEDAPPLSDILYDIATLPFRFDGKGVSVSPVLGGLTDATIRSWQLSQQLETADSVSGLLEGVHDGVVTGRRTTTLTLRVEAGILAEWNPYALRETGEPGFLSLALKAGDHWLHVVSEEAQLIKVQPVPGVIAEWDITLSLHNLGNESAYYLWVARVAANT